MGVRVVGARLLARPLCPEPSALAGPITPEPLCQVLLHGEGDDLRWDRELCGAGGRRRWRYAGGQEAQNQPTDGCSRFISCLSFSLQYEYDTNETGDRVVLGRGTYGVVYAGRDLSNQVRIAIKEIPERDSRWARLDSWLSFPNLEL